MRHTFVFLQDIGVAKTPHWLTRAFSLVERDDLTVNLDQLTTLQKVGSAPVNFNGSSKLERLHTPAAYSLLHSLFRLQTSALGYVLSSCSCKEAWNCSRCKTLAVFCKE